MNTDGAIQKNTRSQHWSEKQLEVPFLAVPHLEFTGSQHSNHLSILMIFAKYKFYLTGPRKFSRDSLSK